MGLIKKIKNNTASNITWVGQTIDSGEYYNIQIDETEEMRWAFNGELESAITKGDAIVNNGEVDISNITKAVEYLRKRDVFGIEYEATREETESTTSSTEWQQKLRLNLKNLAGGKYRMSWNFHWWISNKANFFKARVQIDDTTSIMSIVEGVVNANEQKNESGYSYEQLSSGNHYIDLEFKSHSSSYSASITKCRLDIWRYE